jgi:hypothetical protein
MKKIDISTKKYPNTFTLVDDEDYISLSKFRWFAYKPSNGVYAARITDDKKGIIALHQQLANTPKGSETDHINHNRLDNRRGNLRVCSASQNQWNASPRSGGTSKYKGVSWNKRAKKWVTQICFNRRQIWIGSFDVESDAAKAYDKSARKYHKEFASTNFERQINANGYIFHRPSRRNGL